MDRKEQAVQLHKHGFNCAQSIVSVFAPVMGADPNEAFKMAEGLGLGMGCMETCGALTAMAMVTGMKISDGDMENPKTKKECYAMMQKMMAEFKEANGSIVCGELKSPDNPQRRSCSDIIRSAVEILDRNLLGL